MTLTDAELNELRDELETWFDQLCNIYRATDSDDEYGGSGPGSFALSSSSIPCFLDAGTSVGHRSLEVVEGVLRVHQLYSVSLPPETDVLLNDRIEIITQGNLMLRCQVVMEPESIQIEKVAVCNKLL